MVNPAAADYTLALIFSRLATLGNEPAQTNADSVVKHARYHLEVNLGVGALARLPAQESR